MRLAPWLWRFCRSKWTKRFLIASPVLLTSAVIAFYGLANWYGAKALDEEIAAMKAAGWPMTLEEALGPRPKSEEDLFQHPAILRELSLPDQQMLQALPNLAGYGTISGISRRASGWECTPALSKTSDVRLLADPARPSDPEERVAQDLLIAIEGQSKRFDEMKTAFSRPGVDWSSRSSSFQIHRWVYFVQNRARIRLAAGESALALEDVETMAELVGILMQRGPGVVSFVSASHIEGSMDVVIWEGVKRQAWNDDQLVQLQRRFEGSNRAVNFRRMVRKELAHGLNETRKIHASTRNPRWDQVGGKVWEGVRKRDYGKFKEAWLRSWSIVRPQGLVKLEIRDQFAEFRAASDWLMETPAGRTGAELNRDLPRPRRRESNSQQYLWTLDTYFNAEAKRLLLLTGIALERYRLKHGATAQTLEALVPEFLPGVPKDIYDGQPLRYQVLPDGTPHAWSIWPSGKDEGGIPKRNDTRNTVWTTGQIPGLTEADYNAR